MTYNEDTLIEAGIIQAPLKDKPLVCITKLQMLHNGAIDQLYGQHMELQERYDKLENRLLALEDHSGN